LHRIFNTRTLRSVAITDMHLIGALSVLILIDIILLVIWDQTFPPVLSARGNCGSGSLPFALFLTLEKIVLTIVGIYLCYLVKDIPSAFNESKQITIALYDAPPPQLSSPS
jgi:hypothetical protein